MKLTYFSSGRLLILSLGIFVFAGISVAQSAPLRILDQPLPERPKDYGVLDEQGQIILRVNFLGSGEVGSVFTVAKLSPSLVELAEKAARKIQFVPETRDGKPIDKMETIIYRYDWRDAGWTVKPVNRYLPDPKAEAVLQKAIQNLGGEKYLNVKTQIGRGKYSLIRDGAVASFQTFTDVIVYPDKERTDFKGGGARIVQTNVGDTGWVFDGEQNLVKVQDEKQIASFKRGIRTSLDYLLRGHWRGEGEISYVGRRPATLGKRNEVVKLVYKDGLEVEFEFSADDGLPVKGSYKRLNADNEEVKEEDRYAQFIEVAGIKTPFIVDRFTGGAQTSRINYQSVEFNKPVPDSIFTKPASPKEATKEPKI